MVKIECIGCYLKNKIQDKQRIVDAESFYIQQDYEIQIAGFFVIASKRHIIGFADFTKAEQKEFIELLCNLRKFMRNELKLNRVILFMRESIIDNKSSSSHFHVALLPEYNWMKGKGLIEIFEHAKKLDNKENQDKIINLIKKTKRYFNA